MLFFPIVLLLRLLFPGSPDNASNTTIVCVRPAAPTVLADSSVYHDLNGKLNQYLESTRPEKLYLQLDRTLFRPGETLWFNAYLRNAGDLQPSSTSDILYVELYNPQGSMVQHKAIIAASGTAAGEFDLDASLPGGLYKLKAYTNWMRNTETSFERAITLQKVVLPRLNLKLQFERKAFGPGDEVIARLDVSSLENKALAEHPLAVTARVENEVVHTGAAKTDAKGRTYIRFKLPAKLNSSDGLLNIQLEHDGQPEAISRAIPIVLNKIDLQFFPEGGAMVDGLPCRVAFKALNEFGKPADVEGEVLDESGAVVASFSSFHDGMGAFSFTPVREQNYTARLRKPTSGGPVYQLPKVAKNGFRLHIRQQNKSGLTVEVAGSREGTVYLLGTARDAIFFIKEITVGTTTHTENIPTAALPAGIVRITLLDQKRVEQAERLAFVNRDKQLDIQIKPDRKQYLPRDKVKLDIQVRDHQGNPVQGIFSLSVADAKLLSFADDKQGHILSALLLQQDVKGKIEEPDFYFDATEPKAEEALDYLLMTQGWRRFTWKEVQEPLALNYNFPAEQAIIAGRVVSFNGTPRKEVTVQLWPNGPTTETDIDGNFSFKNPDISKYSYLVCGETYHTISNYSGNILMYNQGVYKKPEIQVKNSAPNCTACTVLSGKVYDDVGEELIGAVVKVLRGNNFVCGTITDYNGDYRIVLDPGTYNVEVSYTGYRTEQLRNLRIKNNTLNTVDITMDSQNVLEEVTVSAFKVPLIEQDKTQSGQTLMSSQIRNLPTRSANAIVATTAGTTAIDGGAVNIKGSRANATNYFVDGIRVAGDLTLVMEKELAQDERFELAESGVVGRQAKRKVQASTGVVAPQRPQYVRAREFYTPNYEGYQQPAERTDFRSTTYWNPKIQTDAKGRAQVEFYTSDAITNFSAVLEGISNQGIPARAEQKFFVQKPLSISVKTPASVIVGDVLQLQLAVSNKTKTAVSGKLEVQVPAHFQPEQPLPEQVQLSPGETRVLPITFNIQQANKPEQALRVRFISEGATLEDALETEIRTLERGFPLRRVVSGNAAQNTFRVQLNQPVAGSIKARLNAYPNPLGDVLKGLERMLRQPSGCFEQVSSSNYPNLLVLDLLKQSGQIEPELERRALSMLESGYKQLAAYECKDGGFDWWGRSPAHEGLTAYGILQFKDMSRVYQVDPNLMKRSVDWLHSRRDGKGDWKRREDWHGWQSEGLLGAYIAWAVSEAGFAGRFTAEIEAAHKQALASKDPYQLALLANALFANGDTRGGLELLQTLLPKQQENGSWNGATHSVFGGRGPCLSIETTALAALALVKSGKHDGALAKAMDFISKSKNEFGYGSTQSTVLALKAIVAYNDRAAKGPKAGTLVVEIDGKRVAEQDFNAKSMKAVSIENLESYFGAEPALVSVYFEKTTAGIPFDLEIEYASRQPQDARNAPFHFKTTLGQTEARLGSTVRLSAQLQNTADHPLASPMIVLGIPAGLSLQPWQLKKLMDENKCDFYELWDGFAVFHFESVGKGESRQIDLDLRADIAGTFEAPAAQAFLYYENDQRVWSKPERVLVRE